MGRWPFAAVCRGVPTRVESPMTDVTSSLTRTVARQGKKRATSEEDVGHDRTIITRCPAASARHPARDRSRAGRLGSFAHQGQTSGRRSSRATSLIRTRDRRATPRIVKRKTSGGPVSHFQLDGCPYSRRTYPAGSSGWRSRLAMSRPTSTAAYGGLRPYHSPCSVHTNRFARCSRQVAVTAVSSVRRDGSRLKPP